MNQEVSEMLMRLDRSRELAGLQRDINRLLEGDSDRQNGFGETQFPLMDVSESENDVVIRALLPGMNRDDVKISLHQNVLSITGDRKEPEMPEDATIVRSERLTGRFQRTVKLLKPIQEDKVTARLTDGVLTLDIPLEEEAKPRRIEVTVN
jgi:HSP20 family protein